MPEEARATIPVGDGPAALVATSKQRLFVANSISDTVTVIDLTTNTAVGTINVAAGPISLVATPDGETVYVACAAAAQIDVIDVTAGRVDHSIELDDGQGGALALDSAAGTLYVANYAAGNVSAIDAASEVVTETVETGGGPFGIAVDPTRRVLATANTEDGSVSVINAVTMTETKRVATGSTPTSIALDPDGVHGYVANAGENTVSRVDLRTGATLKTVAVGGSPMNILLVPAIGKLYVTNSEDATVSIHEVKTLQRVKTVNVLAAPVAATATHGSKSVYVSSYTENQVVQLASGAGGSEEVTRIQVTARKSSAKLRAERSTRLVKLKVQGAKASGQSLIRNVRTRCLIKGTPVAGASKKQTCGIRQTIKKRTAVIKATPRCNSGVRIRVIVTAQSRAHEPRTWKRTWQVANKPAIGCF